ncbi:MAG: hypothetical protein GXP17_09330 [Gammaproteobacteria bacterium]|nr:hypothetical protein [Gammaproteobacteria bacterium]
MAHRPNWPYTFILSLLYVLTAGHPALAEDIEVLTGSSGQNWATPNVLFIVDTSDSMGDTIEVTAPTIDNPSRLTIVKNVFTNLMEEFSGFNAGLMRFSTGGQSGYFVSPMLLLDNNNEGTQGTLIAAASQLSHDGSTPLAETLYEATLFFRGDHVKFGLGRGLNNMTDRNVEGVSDADTNYISPIISQCQRNYIVLLSDGDARHDGAADRDIQRLPGYNSGSCRFITIGNNIQPNSNDCLDELAEYLYTVDQRDDMRDIQKITTYTIGFATDQPLLRDTAIKGGGEYFVANDEENLKNAFGKILEKIQSDIVGANTTFSPPALAANAFSNVSNFDTLYFTLFEPTDSPKWIGNVKPYTLDYNADQELKVLSKNSNVAIDEEGFFVDSSTSLWANQPDGASIEGGGANDQLPTNSARQLFTYTDDYTYTNGVIDIDSEDTVRLNASAIPYDLLGLDETATNVVTTRANIITSTRASKLGDPLHTQPALVTYGGTETDPIMTLFVTTNAGFLHALDAKTGVEQSAFIPKELLKNLAPLSNETGPHPYGLDGDISVWVHDLNNDGDGADSGEHVYLYTGMRRGGNNYYALDVTNPVAPKLLWVIEGNGMNPDFSELGQTWSKPTLANLPVGGVNTKVLIFAGGYDTNQDNTSTNAIGVDDNLGRAVYIVDAKTGAKLWEARGLDLTETPNTPPPAPNLTLADMTNSIPSDIRVLDMDYDHDGYADLLYVGDMRGQIFRFDIDSSGDDFTVEGTLMATLADDDAENNRRFYYAPDVVLTQKPGGNIYLSVNIGSGYRAHPLNPLAADGTLGTLVQDSFYSLRDPYVNGAKPSKDGDFATIEEKDLYDATSALVDGDTSPAALAALNKSGWRIDLGSDGEKVLAPAMTINKQILFTTYTPPSLVERADCNPPAGTGNLYRVSLFDGNPLFAAQTAGSTPALPEAANRVTKLKRPGIPPAPVVIFKEGKGANAGNIDIVDCVGTECNKSPQQPTMTETYWRDES